LLLARNESLPSDPSAPSLAVAARRLECEAIDLPDLLSQISGKFGLPPNIAIGIITASKSSAAVKILDEMPDKAKVRVWLCGDSDEIVATLPPSYTPVHPGAGVTLMQVLDRLRELGAGLSSPANSM
jgi:hypothetical protein